MKTGHEIMGKLQAPSSKLQRSSKCQAPKKAVDSLAIHAGEDQMKFFGFAVKGTGFLGQARLSGSDQSQEILRLLRFLYAPTNGIPEVLFRNAFVRFAVIRSDARAASDKLPD